MTHLTRRAALGTLVAGAAMPSMARAGLGEPIFLDGLGVAIRGYDPVAYFEIQEARKGSLENQFETEDALWWFTRSEYRDLFAANPEKYTPQFGGYDAEGMARGFKRRSDPTVWVLIDDKVYMHYSILDQNRWAEDIRGNIRAAEENWKTLRDI